MNKIEEAKDYLMRATKLLSEFIEKSETKVELEEWMKDRVELWCRIYNEGGSVSQDRFREIWKNMGKNPKGLGGFFTGKPSSIVYDADDNVAITAEATKAILAWTGKTIKEYAKKFK